MKLHIIFTRSYSPAPRRRGDYSVSPSRRHADHPRSPRDPPQERDSGRIRRSYSPGYGIKRKFSQQGSNAVAISKAVVAVKGFCMLRRPASNVSQQGSNAVAISKALLLPALSREI
ncbi:hypothetical protein L1049_011124 [Liquidambar formosana]|uniref:Uncharacterized protein n=1 Tax=Liquidambar formosana TaxID=63359 RepID=A0AAP0RRD8_LIQFO